MIDDLGALRLFVRAAELGSFSRAAEAKGCKISTVSRAVAGLEAALGAALFNRSTRRLHLTEVGQSLLAEARRLLADVDDTWEAVAALNDRPRGVLRLHLPVTFGHRHVLAHMPEFLAAHPDIRLDVTLADAVVDLIGEGADLAVRIGALPSSALVARRLAGHFRVPCAAPAYLARASVVAHPDELMGHECLRFALRPGREWFFARGAERAVAVIGGRFAANTSDALLTAALAGLGVALLPNWLVGDDLAAGRLVRLLPDWSAAITQGPEQAIWAVYAPKRVVSPKVRACIDFLVRRIGDPPYWERPG